VDIAAAIELGKYISVDAADTLSAFMVHRMPDPARILKLFGDLIVTVAAAAKGEQARVAVFGEGVQLLWAQGNAEAAIQVERLTNGIARRTTWIFFAAIVWVPFRAGWTATFSKESVRSIQQFIPLKCLFERSYEAAVLEHCPRRTDRALPCFARRFGTRDTLGPAAPRPPGETGPGATAGTEESGLNMFTHR
jgi:hypothetical protein